MTKLVYSVDEAADALGIGKTVLYRYISSGDIIAVRIASRTVIPAGSLDAFVASRPIVDLAAPRPARGARAAA